MSILLAPLSFYAVLLVVADAVTAVVTLIVMNVPFVPQGKGKEWVYGSVLLMVAFIVSSMIMAFGRELFGLDLLRVRVGISVGFFLFCFVAIVVYYNMSKRIKGTPQIG